MRMKFDVNYTDFKCKLESKYYFYNFEICEFVGVDYMETRRLFHYRKLSILALQTAYPSCTVASHIVIKIFETNYDFVRKNHDQCNESYQ